jgi:D-alanyl-D-alanine carboxypeptidase
MRSVGTARRLAGVVVGVGLLLGARTGWTKDGVEPPSKPEVRGALQAVIDAGLPAVGLVITTPKHTQNFSKGYANLERTKPRMRLRERWRIGGVSKALTATVVLRLVDTGVLGLADTVAQWVPDLLPNGGGITVEQLLAQTSGLPDYTVQDAFIQTVETTPKVDLPPRALVDFVAALPLAFAPGSQYAYSNTNAIVLGLIVEAATGTPFDQALETQVTGPFGFGRTFLPTALELPRPRTRGYSFPVRGAGNPRDVTRAFSPSLSWATGGIVSTALEVARFMRARMGGKIVSAALVDRSIADLRPGQSIPKGPGRNSAGLGIFEYDIPECGTLYGHTGEYPGYRVYAAATRSGRRSIVLLINVSNLSTEQETRLDELARVASCRALQAP